MKKISISWFGDIFLLVALSMPFFSTFRPNTAQAAGAPTIATIKITDDNVQKMRPFVQGDTVVWRGVVNGTWQIFSYNLNTKVTTQVTTSNGSKNRPAVYGDKIVYHTDKNGTVQIHVADISDPNHITDTWINQNDPMSAYGRPNIYGEYVVWFAENPTTHKDVCELYNLNTQGTTIISQANKDLWTPSIYGNKVVYPGYDYGDNKDFIGSYDIVSKQYQTLVTDTNGNIPIMWQNRVVYNTNGQIYYDDLDSGQGPQNISAASADKYSDIYPSIANNLIVYTRKVADQLSILAYNINSKTTTTLDTFTNNGDVLPVVDNVGNTYHVVWDHYDSDTGQTNIWMATVTYPSPVFANLPGDSRPININEGQIIISNPFIIQVHPTDPSGIEKVEFYIDDTLVCTATEPDANGVYSCSWDTSKYHSNVKVIAYDTIGNQTILARTTTVVTELPQTGEN